MPANVHVFDHPLVQHKLTLLRKKETSTTSFRRLLNEIGSLMAYEVTRDDADARRDDPDAARDDERASSSTARSSCSCRSCARAWACSTAS